MTRISDEILGERLRRRAIPTAPFEFRGTRTGYIARHLEPLLPDVSVVERFHHALVAYVQEPDPLFLVREVKRSEDNRRRSLRTVDGTLLRQTDNAPAWWWHAVLFNRIPISPARLPELLEVTPSHMFDVAPTSTVNGAGWHVDHLLNVKDGDTDWQHWSRASVVWRFVRNIHPCNVFYVPKSDRQGVGGNPLVIASVAAYYRQRYAAIWHEFADLARAPEGYGGPVPDGPLVIASREPPSSPPRRAETARARAVSAPEADNWWTAILRRDAPPPVGMLLASHPNAAALTRDLVAGLTVVRLIAIADTLHNKCRPNEMRRAAPGDALHQADLAWDNLLFGVDRTYTRPSGWTRTAELLEVGHAEGLATVARLDIGQVARVCAKLVSGPYREACALGSRSVTR